MMNISELRKVLLQVISVLLLLFTSQAYAKIYKCENKLKEVYYHDKPCPISDVETEMQAEKDVKNGYVPPKFSKKKQGSKKKVLGFSENALKTIAVKEKKVSSASNGQKTKEQGHNLVGGTVGGSDSASKPTKLMMLQKYHANNKNSQAEDVGKNLPALTQEEKRQLLNISVIPEP